MRSNNNMINFEYRRIPSTTAPKKNSNRRILGGRCDKQYICRRVYFGSLSTKSVKFFSYGVSYCWCVQCNQQQHKCSSEEPIWFIFLWIRIGQFNKRKLLGKVCRISFGESTVSNWSASDWRFAQNISTNCRNEVPVFAVMERFTDADIVETKIIAGQTNLYLTTWDVQKQTNDGNSNMCVSAVALTFNLATIIIDGVRMATRHKEHIPIATQS